MGYVAESLIFMSIARDTISESIPHSNPKYEQLVNYVRNEASDYQIMSMLVDGVCPDEKFDYASETKIWSKFSKAVTESFKELSNVIDRNALKSVISEMGPVSKHGYSSSAPIMEFQFNNNLITEKESKDDSNMEKDDMVVKYGGKKFKKKSPMKSVVDGDKQPVKENVYSISTIAEAALGLYGAYKVYSRIVHEASEKFDGKPEDKKAYMDLAKKEGMEAQHAELKKSVSKCSESKDPSKCRAALESKIAKIQSNIPT